MLMPSAANSTSTGIFGAHHALTRSKKRGRDDQRGAAGGIDHQLGETGKGIGA